MYVFPYIFLSVYHANEFSHDFTGTQNYYSILQWIPCFFSTSTEIIKEWLISSEYSTLPDKSESLVSLAIKYCSSW